MKQKEDESINEYAARFRRVLRKVNQDAALPDAHQVRVFINGIKKQYKPMVMSQINENLNTAINRARQVEIGVEASEDDNESNERRNQYDNKPIRKNTFTREKDVKRDAMDELIEKFDKMAIKLANIEQGKTNRNRNNNDKGCFNCGKTGHIARDCRAQRNMRQNTRNNTCNNCGRIGHTERECYGNQICQRCGKKGHTQQVCRSTISRINYTDYDNQDNDDEFYNEDNNEYDDEDEIYVTTRSGFNTQKGRPKKEPKKFDGTHKTVGKAPMKIDENENRRVRRFRGKATIDEVEDYNMWENLMQQQAQVTFAQMLKDPKQQKLLRDAIKRKTHQEEVYDEQ
jgi:hypothetical protein